MCLSSYLCKKISWFCLCNIQGKRDNIYRNASTRHAYWYGIYATTTKKLYFRPCYLINPCACVVRLTFQTCSRKTLRRSQIKILLRFHSMRTPFIRIRFKTQVFPSFKGKLRPNSGSGIVSYSAFCHVLVSFCVKMRAY